MFRRRRRFRFCSIFGLVFLGIGITIMLFTVPLRFWAFIFGCLCFLIGILLCGH